MLALATQFRPGTPQHQAAWEAERLSTIPAKWRARFFSLFSAKKAVHPWQANAWLRVETERFQQYRIPLNASDSDICALAKRLAAECMSVGQASGAFDIERLRAGMGKFCRSWSIVPPDETATDRGAIARMCNEFWWRRKLRKHHARGLEGEAIRLGYVHKRAGIYCSDETLRRRQQQRARNAETLEHLIAENELGDQFTLAALAELSVANPRIRRGELMTRIAGFEACARAAGDAMEFVTLTCPSRFHARKADTGQENPFYEGATPRDAQAYLAKVWARIRAKLARVGLPVYGFRIAEPHHDGCPHWHLLLFMPRLLADGRGAVGRFRAIFRRYALQDSGHEAGAKQFRCKFVSIDWKKGSAAGYIAKYVAKNIDGYGIEKDLFGTPAIEASERVEAWASTWGIRQFQQIGGPSVGVWRELRRIGAGKTEVMEEARQAADSGDWKSFVEAMGGATLPRKFRPVRLAMRVKGEASEVTGEILNQYGEPAHGIPYGVMDSITGEVAESRRFEWRVINAPKGDIAAPWSPVNNCTGGVANGNWANETPVSETFEPGEFTNFQDSSLCEASHGQCCDANDGIDAFNGRRNRPTESENGSFAKDSAGS